MAHKLDFEKLNNMQRYTQWAAFRAIPGALGTERENIIAQAQEFFAALEAAGRVEVRGIYDITAGRAEADYMIRLQQLAYHRECHRLLMWHQLWLQAWY